MILILKFIRTFHEIIIKIMNSLIDFALLESGKLIDEFNSTMITESHQCI